MALCDACDRRPDSCRDGRVGLGAWDHIPALLLEHLKYDGVAFGDALTVDAAVPLTETNLGQGRFDCWHEPEPRRKWSRRLSGATQARDIDRVHAGRRQTVGNEHGLFSPEGRELRISPAVDKREGSIRIGGLRLPVTHEQELGRPGRRLEADLWVAPWGRAHLAAPSIVSSWIVAIGAKPTGKSFCPRNRRPSRSAPGEDA